jgi:hypothetical protein
MMTMRPPHAGAGAAAVLLLALAGTGCAERASQTVQTASSASSGTASPSSSRQSIGYCLEYGTGGSPSPSPSPCITTSETQRYAENHAYRQRVPITATQTAQAAPRAAALLTALTKLSASRTADEAALRSAVVKALGLTANGAEIKGTEAGAPLRYVEVGGGAGRVCVNGAIDGQGKATTEVVGRTLEGTCLEGDGGH